MKDSTKKKKENEMNFDKLSASFGSSKRLENIISVDLSNSHITLLDSKVFSRLVNLESINLSHNQINKLDLNIFTGLSILKSINFSYNSIQKLNGNIFNGLNNLEEIQFEMNEIKYLHANIFNRLKNLKTINFSMNCFVICKEIIFNEMFTFEMIVQNGQRGKHKIILNNTLNCPNLIVLFFGQNKIDYKQLESKIASKNTPWDLILQSNLIFSNDFIKDLVECHQLKLQSKQIKRENDFSIELLNGDSFKELMRRSDEHLVEFFFNKNLNQQIKYDFLAYARIALELNSEITMVKIIDFVSRNRFKFDPWDFMRGKEEILPRIVEQKWWKLMEIILDSSQIGSHTYDFTPLEYRVECYTKKTLQILCNKSGSHPLMMIGKSKQTNLIKHPAILKLLELKYRCIPAISLVLTMLCYLIFVVSFTLNSERMIQTAEQIQSYINSSNQTKFRLGDEFKHVSFNFSLFFLFILFIGELIEFSEKKLKYFLFSKNIFQLHTYIFCLVALLSANKSVKSAFTSYSLLNLYLIFLVKLEMTPLFGIYFVAYKKTLVQFLKLLPIIFLTISGFLFAYRVRSLYSQSSSHVNKSYGYSIAKLITMVLGDFELDKIGLGEEMKLANFFDYLIYIKFIVLMSILLINLTVGISIGEIKTTIDESEIKNINERLKFILNVQGTLLRLSSLLAKVFPKALAKNVFFWERWLVFKIYDASNERNFLYGLQLGSKKTKFKIKDENKNEASTGQNLIQPAAII